MPLWRSILDHWLDQRGGLFGWVPVALACGIGAYFALRWEPDVTFYVGVASCIAACLLLGRIVGYVASPFFWFAALTLVGFCVAGLRANGLAEPVLGWRYYGPVEGRIVGIDRSASDAVRLTLDRVVLKNMSPERTPHRVRVALHGEDFGFVAIPGEIVGLTAHLSPPSGPVEPGGFDFQRHAWFLQLGAVGYTRNPAVVLRPADGGQPLFKARIALSSHVQTRLPGETGAVAAAIMAGDRSGISQDTLKALRVSNLAHLLAISGLHMGLLAGFVFGALRLGMAAMPHLALRAPTKQIAAIGALIAAAFYLGLSGGNVATERAFIMVAVMLTAVLAGRRALSLRAVALAATIILVMRPEALLGPGFQMSFAATTALVAVFGYIRDAQINLGPAWARAMLSVFLSSLVAGLATAPIAAAHFNQFAHFGLIANLLSVPLMGVLVMPMAVVAVCLMPLGLDWLPLYAMELGLKWILAVAHWVSGLDGARGMVMSPGSGVLPLIAFGALVIILWRGHPRWVGVLPVLLGFWLWSGAERPAVLIADTGGLVGVMTDKGRALSSPRGGGFVALNWLENDGDASNQENAHARWGDVSLPIRALRGKRAAVGLESCAPNEWIVMNIVPPEGLSCRLIHPDTLKETGALALYINGEDLRVVTAKDVTGRRVWNTRANTSTR